MYFKDGKIYSEKPEEIITSSTNVITSSSLLKQFDFYTIMIFILLLAYIYLFATKH